jgi:hypothetical protein
MSDLISRKEVLKHIEKIRQGAQMMDDIRRASIIMNGMDLCEEAVSRTGGDTISREEAIETVEFECGEWQGLAQTIVNGLKKLPSAQPERKKGKWIDEGFYADGHGAHAFRCSECGGHIIEYDADPFCKWCGADMRGEEDNIPIEYFESGGK